MGKNNLLGVWGEELAADYLKKKHYKLISMGYRCRFGEIDLIASDRKHLVFVEVKLRRSSSFAQAYEFVDIYKQARLRTTAELYLAQNPTHLEPRFDVIEIYAPQGIQTPHPQIYHMEAAFE